MHYELPFILLADYDIDIFSSKSVVSRFTYLYKTVHVERVTQIFRNILSTPYIIEEIQRIMLTWDLISDEITAMIR